MSEKHQDYLRNIGQRLKTAMPKESNFIFEAADHIDELETQLKLMNRVVSSESVPIEAQIDPRLTVLEHRITMLEQRLHSVPTVLDIESFMMGNRRD